MIEFALKNFFKVIVNSSVYLRISAIYHFVIYRLQRECDDWDRILQDRSRLSEEAARYTIFILAKQCHSILLLHFMKMSYE